MSSVSGNGWYPVYEIKAEVISLGTQPNTAATVSGDANLSSLLWSSPLTNDGTQWGSIKVTANATLTLDAATNFKLLTLNIAGGRTLTLTGANALTATKIEISGNGKVAAATSSLSGALVGCGNIIYTGALPSGVTFNYDWCGNLSLANIQIAAPNFNNYGNVASAIKLSGIKGHVDYGTEYVVPIILDDGDYGFALKLNDGYSPASNYQNLCSTFRKVSGTGSFVDGIAENGKWAWPVIKIYDATGFAGNILLNRRANVIVCDPTTTFPDTFYNMFIHDSYSYLKDGVLRIDGSRRPTLATGKTWSVNVYTDDPDYVELVLFTSADKNLLGGGTLDITVNGVPLDTSRYIVKLKKGQIIIRKRFGYRLRLY